MGRHTRPQGLTFFVLFFPLNVDSISELSLAVGALFMMPSMYCHFQALPSMSPYPDRARCQRPRPNLSDSGSCRHNNSSPIDQKILQIAPSQWHNRRHPTVELPISRFKFKSSRRVDAVEVTSDCLTGWADFIPLLVTCVESRFTRFDRLFGSMRKHSKGHPIVELFIQAFCFFFDGTSRHLTHFDSLVKDGVDSISRTDNPSKRICPRCGNAPRCLTAPKIDPQRACPVNMVSGP